jgi:predicted RND superfamily exporter protein
MDQTQILNLALVLLLLGCLRALFGTWKSGLIFLLGLGFTCALVYGGMALLGFPLDTLAVCLTMMLSIAALEDFVFLSFAQLNDPKDSGFERFIAPSFFTSFTTMIGFGSLAVSELRSISRFGAFAAFGALIEWASFFVILPALAKEFVFFRRWVAPAKAIPAKFFLPLGRFTPSRWVARLSLIVFPIAAYGVTHLPLSQDPSAMFPSDHVFQRSLEYLKSTRSWIAPAYVLFAPEVSSRGKKEVLRALSQEPIVQKIETYDTVVDYVRGNLHGRLVEDLIQREMSVSPAAERFFGQGYERAVVYLKTTQTEAINHLRERVNGLCPGESCRLVGEYVAFAEYSKAFIKTLFESLLVSLFLVGLVLAYLSYGRGWLEMLRLIGASFWGAACMLTYLFLTKSNANSVTCIVASTVVGLTGDNAIQFLFASGKGSVRTGMDKMASASISCTLTVSIACLVFLGSYFEPPRELGILFIIGFLASLAGDLWVLRGLWGSHRRVQVSAES